MIDQRHAKDREAHEMVVHDWEKNPRRFLRAAQAGRYYTEWLAKQNPEYHFKPRVVAGWIRDHAKKLGIKWQAH